MDRIDETPGRGTPPPGEPGTDSDRVVTSRSAPNQPRTGHESESLGELVGGIVGDLQDLVRGEIQLAKTELKENATQAGMGIGMIVGAAMVGLIGFTFLMLTAVEILNQWMPRWAAAGIVALALIVIAAILGMVGKSRLSADNLKPEQSIESLQEDKEWAQQQMNSVKK